MSIRVAIVGAGIGGLTAAVALARAGFEVEVFEQAASLGEIGAGVTLSPNAMFGLRFLGLEEIAIARGFEPQRQRIQHWKDGRILAARDRGDAVRAKYGAPVICIHRADLHEVLATEARRLGVAIHVDRTVASAHGAHGLAALEFADGTTLERDLVVGADGLKSVVRGLLESEAAHYTGHVVWRAILPVTPGVVSELAAYGGQHIGPQRMIVRYPVRDGSLLNVVFLAREEGWTEEGWTIRAERGELEIQFAGWCDEVQALIAATPEGRLNKWAVGARTPLPRWSIGGCVVLLGDAAHAMTPFLGQGAACAIEDGVVLARALAASRSNVAEGIGRYEAARIERTSFIQRESNRNADRFQRRDTENYNRDDLSNEETLGLFDYDCGRVAI